MRNFIWILIIIWTIYQLRNFFKFNKSKNASFDKSQSNSDFKGKKEESKPYRDKEGEYVDYEEIK